MPCAKLKTPDVRYVSTNPTPANPPVKKTVVGKASYYGPKLNGSTTASGEKFHADENTAATNALPLGSSARVTNLKNGKATGVKVTDRIPHKRRSRHTTIDLSKHAAQQVVGIAVIVHHQHGRHVSGNVTRTDGRSSNC